MSKFQDTINRLVPSLSREELADFVLNISRKIPEEFRTTFLRELQRVRVTSRPEPQTNSDPDQLRAELAQVRERLDDIESGALTVGSEFGPGKWDWDVYDLEDYVFTDPMGVGDLLEQAASLVSRLAAAGMPEEASELTLLLLDVAVEINGDGEEEEPLGMEDLLEVGIVPQTVRFRLIDGLYALYSMEPTPERIEELFIVLCSDTLSVTLKDLLRGREPDKEHNERFLHLWVQMAWESDRRASEALLIEAISTLTEGAETLSLVQRYGASHPGLYEWLLTPGNWSEDPDLLQDLSHGSPVQLLQPAQSQQAIHPLVLLLLTLRRCLPKGVKLSGKAVFLRVIVTFIAQKLLFGQQTVPVILIAALLEPLYALQRRREPPELPLCAPGLLWIVLGKAVKVLYRFNDCVQVP